MKNPFLDDARIHVESDGFGVEHTHWTKRKMDFSAKWTDVSSMVVTQREPAILEVEIRIKDRETKIVSEDMAGWLDFLAVLRMTFPGFDWNSFEDSKSKINEPVQCWSRD